MMKCVLRFVLLCALCVSLGVDAAASRYVRSLVNGGGSTSSKGLVDSVNLVPFDVQIAITANNGIQTFEVSNIVTDWMNAAYADQLAAFGYTEENMYAKFNTVVLLNNGASNDVQNEQLFTAKFKGGAVFVRDANRTKVVPENDVLYIQQFTLLNATALTERLQSSPASGLGSAVVHVLTFPNSASNGSGSGGSHLEIVIVVAIVVACVAFLFLLGAVFWAYHYDRANREAFLMKEHALTLGSPDRTDSDTACDNESPERIRAVHVERSAHSYPTVIGGDDVDDIGYPASVISDSIVSGSVLSEDISTSLSQYYKAGMGKVAGADYSRGGGLLSDAGSVSSMESYGYSLDGGMTAPLPTEIPYQRERQRIGGLPVEPDDLAENYDTMDDVQIPDLTKELANLDIKLTPSMEIIDVETYSQQDLEEYQMEDLEEMEALSQRSPGRQLDATSTTSSLRSKPVDVTPVDVERIDVDEAVGLPDDVEDRPQGAN